MPATARTKGVAAVLAVAMVSGLLAGCATHRRQSLKDEAAPSLASRPKAVRYKARPAKIRTSVLPPVQAPLASSTPVPLVPSEQKSTCGSDEVCLARLKALVADKTRAWVGQPQAAVDHLGGTRQFAYLALRSKLTCKELSAAIKEITAVSSTLAAPGVSTAHVQRVRKLDVQVVSELRNERSARCTGF